MSALYPYQREELPSAWLRQAKSGSSSRESPARPLSSRTPRRRSTGTMMPWQAAPGLGAGRCHGPPQPAGEVLPVAADLASACVARVGVERVTVISRLQLTAGPSDRAEPHRQLCARRRLGRPDDRWPVRRARARALGGGGRVNREPVQRLALRIDQDRADARSCACRSLPPTAPQCCWSDCCSPNCPLQGPTCCSVWPLASRNCRTPRAPLPRPPGPAPPTIGCACLSPVPRLS